MRTRMYHVLLIKDTSNFNKMIRYLDLLEENSKSLGANVFDRLVQFLGDHPVVGGVCSIHDQLMTELAAERNELPIDGYLEVETSIMVDREFAGQGRTDAERRDIAAQITCRLQVYKEVIAYECRRRVLILRLSFVLTSGGNVTL
jgi:hypothetical protein